MTAETIQPDRAPFPPTYFDADTVWGKRPPARRMRGLRLKAVPSGALVAQLVGGLATLGGVFLTWGTNVTLIVGGVAIMALGTLREAGKI